MKMFPPFLRSTVAPTTSQFLCCCACTTFRRPAENSEPCFRSIIQYHFHLLSSHATWLRWSSMPVPSFICFLNFPSTSASLEARVGGDDDYEGPRERLRVFHGKMAFRELTATEQDLSFDLFETAVVAAETHVEATGSLQKYTRSMSTDNSGW